MKTKVRAKGKKYPPRKKIDVNRPGLYRRNAPDTSREAAYRIGPVTGKLRVRVLLALIESPNGLIDEEIQQRTGIKTQTETARRNELVNRDKVVRDSGRRRKTSSGCKATVWEVIPGVLDDYDIQLEKGLLPDD